MLCISPKSKITKVAPYLLLLIAVLSVTGVVPAFSQEEAVEAVAEEAPEYALKGDADILWTCVAAFMVFFMQAGFALVESGMTRAKNALNILMKNYIDMCFGAIAFFLVGFGIMFGTSAGGFIGTDGFALTGYMIEEGGGLNYWTFTFWVFQAVFAATAATIVSGAMAERTKFSAYIVFSVIISAFIYPVFGSWAWGGLFAGSGWLEGMGFIDYAGSTVVHSVGAWAGLAGAIVLGPRKGKYSSDGKPQALPGHNLPMAGLGVFILWFGWFGFNPGSTTSIGGDMAVIAVTTMLAAAAGTIGALLTSWVKFKYPDVGMTFNGCLAGLVSITAPCYNVSPLSAIVIGFIGGIIVVLSVIAIENIGIDDPVGAVSVHGVCGAWGTLAAGIFAQEEFGGTAGLLFGGGFSQVITQVIGIVAAFAWAFITSYIMFTIIKATIGLRVTQEEEYEGLDLGEHGGSAYPDFNLHPSH